MKGSTALALRLALREMRGGLRGFRVFLICLVLGVAAISAVGMLRQAISAGLDREGAVMLGGDARLKYTYRYATEAERAFMERVAQPGGVSEILDFRSMAVRGEGEAAEHALTQVKGVDGAWPLLGAAEFEPAMPVAEVFAPRDGLPGAAMDRVLADRLGLIVGETFRLGVQSFHLSAILVSEPDNVTGGFGFGPRTLVKSADLAEAGLLGPGTLFETEYRLRLPAEADLNAVKAEAEAAFPESGLRWQDRRRAAPGIERFVERMASFLVLVGLAGLAVGGVGISSAVRAWAESKTATIATLKTLGAGQGLIFRMGLLQIGLLTLLGIALGLVLGTMLPLLAAPLLSRLLPVPAVFEISGPALAEAAFYGALTALIFTLWPLARMARIRAASLYRDGLGRGAGPGMAAALMVALLSLVLLGGAVLFSGMPAITLAAGGGIALSLGVLLLVAAALRRLAGWLARRPLLRGRVALRMALSSMGGPGGELRAVVLALGLGLTVLSAVGQIDANLRRAIGDELPERAPSYFFVDIQNDQIGAFLAHLEADAAVRDVETAPMLRGVLSKINGRPAKEVAGEHWVARGDRGLTYADTLPEGTRITAGRWWEAGHSGPPEVSFAQKEADEIGLKLGDKVTVTVLGRGIEAEITSFREVDFRTGGIGFVMVLSPDALAGAPHTHIATVYSTPEEEGRVLREIAQKWPNITAIPIRDAVATASEALSALATATSAAALATLLTGFVVLVGASAAGERARVYEAAVLKVLGASRASVLAGFALRSALAGAAAAAVAVLAGSVASWAVMRFVMELPWRFAALPAALIISGGVLVVLIAGAVFLWRPLAARPASVLRARD
ncbi:ABC transporter permease [Falsigemmobacter intermedius]|uniref:ABC transporter permease n=1 Tax=Falsigemmobacter intermedius TaxID=1553448 RepID=UPI003F11B2D2